MQNPQPEFPIAKTVRFDPDGSSFKIWLRWFKSLELVFWSLNLLVSIPQFVARAVAAERIHIRRDFKTRGHRVVLGDGVGVAVRHHAVHRKPHVSVAARGLFGLITRAADDAADEQPLGLEGVNA